MQNICWRIHILNWADRNTFHARIMILVLDTQHFASNFCHTMSHRLPNCKCEEEFLFNLLPRWIPGEISMHNSNSLYCSTLNASTASAGIGTLSRVDLLTYLHTRSDGACVRGRSTRPSVDPRPRPIHLARARAASSSTFTQARSADSARRSTLYFNAIFLPCPAQSRPAAARTAACQ